MILKTSNPDILGLVNKYSLTTDWKRQIAQAPSNQPPYRAERSISPQNIWLRAIDHRQNDNTVFEPYPRAIKAAPLWCSLGCRSKSDGRIHQ